MKVRSRLLLSILSITFLFFLFSISFIGYRFYTKTIEEQIEKNVTSTHLYATRVNAQLNSYMEIIRQLARSVQRYEVIPEESRREVFSRLMYSELGNNPNLRSVWSKLEVDAIDRLAENWIGKRGSSIAGNFNFTYFKNDNNRIGFRLNRSRSVEKVFNSPIYKRFKEHEGEAILDPYRFAYYKRGKEYLQANLITTVTDPSGKFMGIMGADISMEELKRVVVEVELQKGCNSFLFYSDFDDEELLEEERFIAANTQYLTDKSLFGGLQEMVLERIKKIPVENHQDTYEFQLQDSLGQNYLAITFPIQIGNAPKRWYYTQLLPRTLIVQEANSILFQTFGFSLIGLLILGIVLFFMIGTLTTPLAKITHLLNQVAQGRRVVVRQEESQKRKNEVGQMFEALGEMVDDIDTKAQFAAEIGKGNYQVSLKVKSEQDVLGHSLLQMKDNLLEAQNNKRTQDWVNKGVFEFSGILKQEFEHIDQLTEQILEKIVKYLGVQQGYFYLTSVNETGDAILKLSSAYAKASDKKLGMSIEIGKGIVGQVWKSRKAKHIQTLPKGLFSMESGLGEGEPKEIYLLPITILEETYGVIEFSSLSTFEPHHLQFIEHTAETIAVVLKNEMVV